jgi:hypothetical protein
VCRIEAQFVVAQMRDVRVDEVIEVVVEQAVVTSGHRMDEIAAVVLGQIRVTTIDMALAIPLVSGLQGVFPALMSVGSFSIEDFVAVLQECIVLLLHDMIGHIDKTIVRVDLGHAPGAFQRFAFGDWRWSWNFSWFDWWCRCR